MGPEHPQVTVSAGSAMQTHAPARVVAVVALRTCPPAGSHRQQRMAFSSDRLCLGQMQLTANACA